jgi:hypothetical protein
VLKAKSSARSGLEMPPPPSMGHGAHSYKGHGTCGRKCYVLILPLLFLMPPHLLIHLHTRHLILGTALLSSLTSLIPFPLTPLTSSLTLPQNLLTLLSYYTLGHIPLTASLSSVPIILTGTLQSFGLRLVLMRLTPIRWNTLPFATNMSALLITLMVATDWLGSYLASYLLYLLGSPIGPFLLSPCVSAIFSSYCSLVFQLASYGLTIVPSLARGCASLCI